MATVRMKKGDKYADVYDSPETIRQAELEGYSLCEKPKHDGKEQTANENENEGEGGSERKVQGGGKRQ